MMHAESSQEVKTRGRSRHRCMSATLGHLKRIPKSLDNARISVGDGSMQAFASVRVGLHGERHRIEHDNLTCRCDSQILSHFLLLWAAKRTISLYRKDLILSRHEGTGYHRQQAWPSLWQPTLRPLEMAHSLAIYSYDCAEHASQSAAFDLLSMHSKGPSCDWHRNTRCPYHFHFSPVRDLWGSSFQNVPPAPTGEVDIHSKSSKATATLLACGHLLFPANLFPGGYCLLLPLCSMRQASVSITELARLLLLLLRLLKSMGVIMPACTNEFNSRVLATCL